MSGAGGAPMSGDYEKPLCGCSECRRPFRSACVTQPPAHGGPRDLGIEYAIAWLGLSYAEADRLRTAARLDILPTAGGVAHSDLFHREHISERG